MAGLFSSVFTGAAEFIHGLGKRSSIHPVTMVNVRNQIGKSLLRNAA